MVSSGTERQEPDMFDFVFLALGLGGFGLLAAYARACDRI